jgi:carboxymethylenebutenolidase
LEKQSPVLVERAEALGRFHRPAVGDSFPGLVLIHDVWGLSEHSRQLATDLASAGFGVLELDLYRELGSAPSDDPGGFIRSLSDPDILADLDRGADWLVEQATCRGRTLGLVGVCMGGTFALLAACQSDRFSAAAPFYGILSYEAGLLASPDGRRDHAKKPRSPIEAGSTLRMPILASFGDDDDFVPGRDVDALAAALVGSGMRFEIDRYAGAGHAFLNRTRPEAYRSDAAARAWARVTAFLHSELD